MDNQPQDTASAAPIAVDNNAATYNVSQAPAESSAPVSALVPQVNAAPIESSIPTPIATPSSTDSSDPLLTLLKVVKDQEAASPTPSGATSEVSPEDQQKFFLVLRKKISHDFLTQIVKTFRSNGISDTDIIDMVLAIDLLIENETLTEKFFENFKEISEATETKPETNNTPST